MDDLTLVIIGGVVGLVLGIASAFFVMPVLRKGMDNSNSLSSPAQRDLVVRLFGISEVVIFAVVGAMVAYFGFGGAS